MKKQNFILLVSFTILFFSSCKTLQIEKPKESYLPSNLAPAVSELPLQVEIDIKKLEAAINKKMNGIIFEGTNLSGKDLSVKVSKAQNFTFTVKNNVIEYRVPLKVWCKFAWKVEKFGISVGDFYEATGSIALTYKTSIGLDKNWKLSSKTAGSGYEWIEVPKLNVVGVSVPVTPIASLALTKCDQLISEQIDIALGSAVDLKKYVSQAWGMMQTPRQVNVENNVWLRIAPKDVFLSPLTTNGNKLKLSVALSAQIESFMGVQPTANAKVTLPPLKQLNRPAEEFNLNIAADVTFDKISEMAKKELINKTFTEGKRSITITDLSIFGSEGKAIFVADVKGALNGRIYFTGKLVYNAEKMVVEVTEPEFDVKTQSTLVKSAGWLLHGMILKSIAPYLSYSVKENLDKTKKDVNQMINNYPIMDGINLLGNLNKLTVTQLHLIPGAVRIEANVTGKVAIKVEDLKF
jgi:hypothetical protein